MAKPARKEVVRALLERSGRTYAEQLRINVESNRPSELFRLLCAAVRRPHQRRHRRGRDHGVT